MHGWKSHHAAVTLLSRRWSFCLSSNRGSQTEAFYLQAQLVQGPSAVQCPAGLAAGCTCECQVRLQDKGNGWDRGYFPSTLLQVLSSLPLLEALIPNPLLTQGAELAQTCINPRSCFWATVTKSVITRTSFQIYARSIHPTHILSTVFEALCSLGWSGWILPRIHNLVLIIPSCWALEHRAFSLRTTATRANELLCYQEANPLQSAEDPALMQVTGKLLNNKKMEFVNSSGKERVSAAS